jgi:branched-chain amino acid transport system permease protein
MGKRKGLLNDFSLMFFLAVLVALYPVITNAYLRFVLMTAIINCILVVGLHFIFGLMGQLHMGMAAFWGIGSYVFALAITRLHWPFWPAMLAAAVGVGLVGLLLGFPTLRLKGFYLAITTIGFGEIIRLILLNWAPVTGGVFGIAGIPRPTIGPLTFLNNQSFYYLSLAMLAVLVIGARMIEGSKFGRAFRAIHDDELASEAIGLNSTTLKVLAFVLCGIYAGVGGGMYASLMQYISPEVYALERSQMLVMMLVIGGMGSLPGALLGTVLLTFLPEVLRFLKLWYLAVYGAIVIVIIVYRPTGLYGLWELFADYVVGLFRRKEKTHGVA